MKGRVKTYKEEKGYGFILGEDGNDYFFHSSNVKSLEIPTVNTMVEFQNSSTDKGLCALDITVTNKNKPTIFHMGELRIRFSNIKKYTLVTSDMYTKYREFVGLTGQTFYYTYSGCTFSTNEPRLFVYTYQGDISYSWGDDIYNYLKTLDEYFS